MTETQPATGQQSITCPNGHQGTFTLEQQSSTLLYVPPRLNADGERLWVPDPNQRRLTYRCDQCGVRSSVVADAQIAVTDE